METLSSEYFQERYRKNSAGNTDNNGVSQTSEITPSLALLSAENRAPFQLPSVNLVLEDSMYPQKRTDH
jgi:hypothetical protein